MKELQRIKVGDFSITNAININEILTRYMPLNIFFTCLKNNSLRFSKPRTWIEKYDVFEDLLSNVEYKKTNLISKIGFCSVEPY